MGRVDGTCATLYDGDGWVSRGQGTVCGLWPMLVTNWWDAVSDTDAVAPPHGGHQDPEM